MPGRLSLPARQIQSLIRRHSVNIALAIVALVGVIAVIVTTGGVTTSEKEARENNVLAAWREDDLRKLVFEKNGDKVSLERRPSGDAGESTWFITTPFVEEADAFAVDSLLRSLEFASATRRIKGEEVDRVAFGLDHPSRSITLAMGAISYRLLIGKETVSPKGGRYLEVTGEGAPRQGVMIISSELAERLDVGADSLRERTVMPYLSSSLSRLVLEGSGGLRKLRRAEWGGFRFDGMFGDVRVGVERLEPVLVQLARATAEHFIDVALAEKALSNQETVTITMVPEKKSQPVGVVQVGGRCPKSENDVIALRRAPDRLAACVPKSVMPALELPAEQLIDDTIFSLSKQRIDAIESLSIVRDGQKFELERKEKGFVLRKPQSAEVDLEVGNARLAALVGARGKLRTDADKKAFGLDAPRGRATIKYLRDTGTALVEETVALGATAANGGLYLLREQDGAILELSRDEARLLSPDATLVRRHKIFGFEPSELRWVDMRGRALSQRFVRNDNGTFALERPAGFAVDAGLASDTVDVLASLTADRWVADHDDGSFGLGAPELRIGLSLASGDGGTKQHALLVGERTSGGAYARLEPDAGVFVLSSGALETLETLVLDRSVFMVDPAEAERITLHAAQRTITLVRRGERFEPQGRDGDLSPGRVQQITDALSTLRAEAAVHTGPARPEEGLAKPLLEVTVERLMAGGERPKLQKFRVGAGDSWRRMSIHFARADGVDATYVIARNKVAEIVGAL